MFFILKYHSAFMRGIVVTCGRNKNLCLFTLLVALALIAGCQADRPQIDLQQFSRFGIPEGGYWYEDTDTGSIVHYLLVGYANTDSDSPYTVIDTLSCNSPALPCDSTTIAYVVGDESGYHLIALTLEPYPVWDTVLTITDSVSVDWLRDLLYFHLDPDHAILAYSESGWSDEAPSVQGTVILRIIDRRSYDTLAVIDSSFVPSVISDGSQVLMHGLRSTPSTELGWTYDIKVFDVELDTCYYPAPSDPMAKNPYRRTRNDPLYFMRYDPEAGLSALWKFDDNLGEVRVSEFTQAPYPKGYEVTPDSVIYYFRDDTVGADEEPHR